MNNHYWAIVDSKDLKCILYGNTIPAIYKTRKEARRWLFKDINEKTQRTGYLAKLKIIKVKITEVK